MESNSFWIVYWQTPNRVFGKVLGTEIKEFADTTDSLLKQTSSKIRKIYIQSSDFERLTNMMLKTISVDLSLSYSNLKKTYSLPYKARLDQAYIFGNIQDNSQFRCFVPYLELDFIYFNKEQLTDFTQHFIREKMSNLTPEEIFRYTMPCEPFLKEIKIELKESYSSGKISYQEKRRNSFLGTLVDKLPIEENKKARVLPEATWERRELIKEVMSRIESEEANIILCGDSGVGKTAIINSSIQNIIHNQKVEVDPITFWKTNSRRLIANAKYLGQWQENCERLVSYLNGMNGILYITDILELMHIGGEGVFDSVAAYLLLFLKEKRLRLIGEMTHSEYLKGYQILPAFMESFQVITVPEMQHRQVISILENCNKIIYANKKKKFSDQALHLIYRLTSRYIHTEKFPGKAIRFFTECLKKQLNTEKETIDVDVVNEAFSKKTGFPEVLIRDDVILREGEVEDYFRSKIIGQEDTIKYLASVVHSFKTGMNDANKPIATLLFSGSTGVGKTATTKALADYFFGIGFKVNPLFRLDMSEYQSPYQIRRLIGMDVKSPSKLIQHVISHPFSVILFDEIEKADPSFFDVLMTMMDEGIFSDTMGREVNFRSCILIMTTNVGNTSTVSVGFEENKTDHKKSIYHFFRPEFLNRIDHILYFQDLSKDSIKKITLLELEILKKREGILSRNIDLVFSDSLISYLAEKGFHPLYGARPLQRHIERHLVSALSKFLLEFPKLKSTTLFLDWNEREVVVKENSPPN